MSDNVSIDDLGYKDLCEQGKFHCSQFRRFGRLDDIEKAIVYGIRAMDLTRNGHPELSTRHDDLGLCYRCRFRRLGNLKDMEKSIEHFMHAVELTASDDPALGRRLGDLGISYRSRYQRLGALDDLEKSIDHCSQALALTPAARPDLPRRHADLGVSYSDRYRRLGALDDLEKSIGHMSQALALTPADHPSLPDRHAALGVSYNDRYRRLGALDDLEKSIEHDSQALALTPADHPHLPGRHAALGVSYNGRYGRLGALDDLEKSIDHCSRALALTPADHPDLPGRHTNIGVSHAHRYRRLRALGDLEKSIYHCSQALALTPPDHPDLQRRHANLGVSHGHRYRRLRALDDLKKSIDHKSQALALTPPDHPDLPDHHANLGVSYTVRYRRLRALEDLEKSIEHGSRALILTPDEHPYLSLRHFNLATSYHRLYQHTNNPSHLDISLASFRKASQFATGMPRDVFKRALSWANRAFRHRHLNRIEAFSTTIDLLPHFIWLGATTAQRYQDLLLVESLAIRAASAAVKSSEHSLALEWLEHARCVVWNQTLALRSPLDDLASSHAGLATRLQTTSEQLHHASSDSSPSNSTTHTPEHRHRLAREYNNLLAEVRSLPGFEKFLQPKNANALIQAARNGPIAVINCHQKRCDALLVLPGQASVSHLALSSFTEEKAQHARSEIEALLKHKKLRERGVKIKGAVQKPDPDVGPVLADLWNNVVKPVLECLGYLNNDPAEDLPHITWCPTGAMTFLPLHAAGDYTQTRSRVFDHVISSYTPTLTALLASTPTQLNRAPKMLAIGQSATRGFSPLPGVVKELEGIKARTQGRAAYVELTDTQATAAAVLDAMDKSDWVHMACHAHQNVVDPTKSGFFLHGGILDLATISQRSFRNKGLAFLSACQTATGDEKLPDEAIHLASGMLMAGYSSVIGTMWSVVDEDAPFVADRVYEQLMKDEKIGNGEAGRALHDAVGGLREKVGEKEFARWAPYIHIGS